MTDPVAVAQAHASRGFATRLCTVCQRAGRIAPALREWLYRPLDEDKAYFWAECPECHSGYGPFEVPIAFMLAREIHAERISSGDEIPQLIYEVEDEHVTFYLDPGDGGDLVRLAEGQVKNRNVRRSRAAADVLAGGNARRELVRDDEGLVYVQ